MNRRETLLAMMALGAAPLAGAQQTGKVFRIGYLVASSLIEQDRLSGPFFPALAALGYVEGRNLIVESRSADGNLERLPTLAREIVATKPDLIFAPPAPATAAVKALTTTIPTVYCYVNDPVALGFAQSLAHPGGNLTGLSNFSVAIAGKRVELIKELLPKLQRLCAWTNPDAINDTVESREVQKAATQLSMQYLALNANKPADYEAAANETHKWRADAIYIVSNPAAFANRKQIIALVAGLKIPVVYFSSPFVEDGGLMSYAVNFQDLARRAATYADKILKGARPGDLPVEQPTLFELTINIGTAKALGLKVPQSMLARADRIIE